LLSWNIKKFEKANDITSAETHKTAEQRPNPYGAGNNVEILTQYDDDPGCVNKSRFRLKKRV
jgi:hypothetical protein